MSPKHWQKRVNDDEARHRVSLMTKQLHPHNYITRTNCTGPIKPHLRRQAFLARAGSIWKRVANGQRQTCGKDTKVRSPVLSPVEPTKL
ncbi:hypothetical protein T265_05372 [Opisthorchis viverrini]|uniref:Uncharacterized protein n=1 Tax=Opisthorchis viverrini TaxID=6198 RepID=A0A074ZWF0_OPIVI|nr:hypothetical protein T265_05372 [Opisthorchis viverrini]KER27655.1 hypothetical protein T265_05372 [Opisthorchis viverrini]